MPAAADAIIGGWRGMCVQEWRQAGISYLRYANICAQVVRRSLKAELQAKASLRDISHMKVIEYEDGKSKAVRFQGEGKKPDK